VGEPTKTGSYGFFVIIGSSENFSKVLPSFLLIAKPMDQKSLYNFKKGWRTDDFHYNYFIYADLNRINDLGEVILKENIKKFYVYNYDKLSN